MASARVRQAIADVEAAQRAVEALQRELAEAEAQRTAQERNVREQAAAASSRVVPAAHPELERDDAPSAVHDAFSGRAPPTAVAFLVVLAPSASRAVPRATLTVAWNAYCPRASDTAPDASALPTQPGSDDWVGLYPTSAPRDFMSLQAAHRWVHYVDGLPAGSATVALPSTPGTFEFRYVHESGFLVAVSSRIVVAAASAAPAAERQAPRAVVADDGAHREAEGGGQPSSLHNFLPSSAGADTVTPPFLLETHARISVYTLFVPLPLFMRARADAADGAAPRGVVHLERGWAPGVRVLADSAAALASGVRAGVEVLFELPRVGSARSAYEATAEDVAECVRACGGGVALPRQLYRLRLHTPHRIEASRCGMKLYGGHFAVRLPMYYTGSVLPDRPASLTTADETLSLRRQGRRLACKGCGGLLMQRSPGDGPKGATPWAMTAFLLPSEHWLEWADMWLCHETQANVYIPAADFGARRGTLLIGETHVAVHPGDVRPDALLLLGSAEDGEGGESAASVESSALSCPLACGRCLALLGKASYPRGPALPSFDDAAALPDALRADLDFVLSLHKDRLSVPLDAAPERCALPGDEVQPRPANALAHYGVCSRLATALLASAQTRSQYRFVLVDGEDAAARLMAARVAANAEADALPADAPAMSRVALLQEAANAAIARAARVVLILVNWNASVRASPVARGPEERVDTLHTLLRPHPPVEGADAPPRADAPFCTARDMPVLQLQYSVVGAGLAAGSEALAERVLTWANGVVRGHGSGGGRHAAHGHSHGAGEEHEEEEGMRPPEPVSLLPEELQEVIAVLQSGTALLPAAARSLGGGGSLALQLGYLPFLAADPSNE
jgi:hypothetical protein